MAGFTFQETSLFLPLRLGATAHDTLQEFIDIDVTAEDLVNILQRNQTYKDLFSRFVNQKTQPRARDKNAKSGEEKKAVEPENPTHRLVNLLGMIGSRNLLLALRMHKSVTKTFPINEEGAVDLKAGDYLKRALETEESFLRAKLEYSETAFAASVYYDWLIRALSTREDFKRRLETYAELTWKRAVRSGTLAYFLAQEVKGVAPKHALAAGFLLPAGKILLAAQLEGYTEFESAEDANPKLTPLARLLREREKCGVGQEQAGAHSLRYFNVFDSLIPVVRYFREPYCLKGHAQYPLAALLYLADAMARTWRIPADEKDPCLGEWAHPSLKHFRLKASTLIAVMKSAMTLR